MSETLDNKTLTIYLTPKFTDEGVIVQTGVTHITRNSYTYRDGGFKIFINNFILDEDFHTSREAAVQKARIRRINRIAEMQAELNRLRALLDIF